MKNKIGINVSFLRKPATGIGQVVFNYLKVLNKNPQNFKFYLYAEEKLPKDLNLTKNFREQIFLTPYKRDDLIRKIWWEKFLLPQKIKQDNCSAFISLYQCPTILPKNVKHTMVVHDIIPKLFPEYLNNWRKKLYWKLTERAIKRADKIIAISECTKNDLVKHLQVPAEKIEVRYLDVDEIYKKEVDENESVRVLQKYNLEKGYIYFGGGLEKRKNVKTLLKAYERLMNFEFQILNFNSNSDDRISKTSQTQNTKHKIPKLVVSGKLMPELAPLVTDVEKLVKELGLEDKVRLLDFVPQEDLPALYKNAQMFIYPSLYEGFGLPVLEAMNCGTPVICSNASSLSEVGGEAVEYFNPRDAEELAKKIKLLLNNENLRQEFIRKGKERAKKFSWEEFIN